jgi:hypothetical protein
MKARVCQRKEKGSKCVRCLSLSEELLKVEDLPEEQREKVEAISEKCRKGAAITEAQVRFLYDLRDEFLI